MQLEFDRTPEHVIEFNLHELVHSAAARRDLMSQRLGASLLFAALFCWPALLSPGRLNAVILGAAFTGGLVIFLVYPLFARRSTVDRIRKRLNEGTNDTLFGHQSISIAPDGISTRNRTSECKIKWEAVHRVDQGTSCIFLFTSGIQALVIPKSCFPSDDDRMAFLQLVEMYRKGN